MSGRRRIVVVFGGRSAEHEISCISARSVMDALDRDRFDVVPVGITKQGTWHLLPGPPALPSETGRMPEVTAGSGASVVLSGETASRELVGADGSRAPIDVVLPVLHGPMGEDGAVQGMLELADVPYVGAGVLGSAIGMDKAVQKVLFAGAGLPVGPWEPVREPEWLEDHDGVSARIEALGFPVFAKPATLGSSVGISKVHRPEELDAAMAEAFRFARKAVVEQGFEGVREIECAVLGNDDPVASVCGEIVPTGHEFYDYASKYLDEQGARLDVPARSRPPGAGARAAHGGRRVPGGGMLGHGPRRLLPARRGAVRQRDQHDPGIHRDQHVPEAVGSERARLRRRSIERLIDLAVERHEAERSKRTTAPELERGE